MSKKTIFFYRLSLVYLITLITLISLFAFRHSTTTSAEMNHSILTSSYHEREFTLNPDLTRDRFIDTTSHFNHADFEPTVELSDESTISLIKSPNQETYLEPTSTPQSIPELSNKNILSPTMEPSIEQPLSDHLFNFNPEASLQSMSSQSTAELAITNVTETSFGIQAIYPISGIHGNLLAVRDKSTGIWTNILSNYATDGYYTVNTLKPANSYDVQLLWYTDATHTWTRQDIIQTVRTKSYEPSVHIVNSTGTSLTVNTTYPASGVNGNGLFLLDHVTNQWRNIAPDWYTYSGEYTVTGLTPGRNYTIQQVWYRDYTNDWLRREILKPFSTNPKTRYVYDAAGRIDYIILKNNQTIEFEYDDNGNLVSRNSDPIQ